MAEDAGSGLAPLGAHPGTAGTRFTLWSPGAAGVEVCTYDEDGNEERHPLQEGEGERWSTEVRGIRAGTRYGYRVDGEWDPRSGRRWNPHKLLLDPYTRGVDGALLDVPATRDAEMGDPLRRNEEDSAPHVPKSVVLEPSQRSGRPARPQVPWSETVLYEAHVKSYTQKHPEIPPELRGTYAGLAHPAATSHLQQLGVTTVELLPVQAFVSEPHLTRRGLTNHWGYNTLAHLAPHRAYSSVGTPEGAVEELQDTVDALHAAGLEVILDVVYNHTAEGDETGPTLCQRGIANRSYYRVRDGRYEDWTGCGNTLDVRNPQVLALVTDSLRYWAEEIGVDGFRFDLLTALLRGEGGPEVPSPLLTTILQDPTLRDLKLIAEPWDALGGYQVGELPAPWREWNDQYRGHVRDAWAGRGRGVRMLGYRLSGSSDLYQKDGRRPSASVNFVTAHDGFTLSDLVTHQHKQNEANGEGNRDGTDDHRSWNCGVEGPSADPATKQLRRRQRKNLLTTLLLSPGVPMLLSGDELGNTQGGNNNAYCQDNETSWLEWEEREESLEELVTTLTTLRREHPYLHRGEFYTGERQEDGRADLGWFRPDGDEMTETDWADEGRSTLGVHYTSTNGGHLMVVNTGSTDVPWTLPGKPWAGTYTVEVDTSAEEARGEALTGGDVRVVPAHSVLVLQVEKAERDPEKDRRSRAPR